MSDATADKNDGVLTPQPRRGRTSRDWKTILSPWLAVIFIFAFGYYFVYLMHQLNALDETHWNRAIYLYGGLEAVFLASVGWFFGKEVHRERAEAAERRAEAAQDNAQTATEKKGAARGVLEVLHSFVEEQADPANTGRTANPHLGHLVPLLNSQLNQPDVGDAFREAVEETVDPQWAVLSKMIKDARENLSN